jgi:hypothetical protein
MPSKRPRAAVLLEANHQQSRLRSVELNEALRELINHLAEELALEYVRLMKTAKRGTEEPK